MPSRKIIIDTDPGVDDVIAVLLALASPELDVIGITITFGNTHAQTAYDNLLKIYAALDREFAADPEAINRFPALSSTRGRKTILAKGAEGPVGGEKHVAAYFHGKDGLSNIDQTHPHFTAPPIPSGQVHEHLEISKKEAYEVILDLLEKEEEGTVTIVAIGPLTNLAMALAANPKTFSRVGEVVWMGGTLELPGNTSPTAEFNCYADPYAAQAILEAVESNQFHLVMCPLDITSQHTVPFDQLIHSPSSSSNSHPPTPLKQFTTAVLTRVRGLMKNFGEPDEMQMHDPLAIWYAIENASRSDLEGEGKGRWGTQRRVFKVERSGEYTRGMCVVDRRGTGESSFLRIKGDIADGVATDNTGGTGKAAGAPCVVVKTPGKEVLGKLLLERIFGNNS